MTQTLTNTTQQELLARYFRLDDPLCREFLRAATVPAEFEGLKLLFPFVRDSSVMRGPRSLAPWMPAAFMAGCDFGRAHPELTEVVLPDGELAASLRRLHLIVRHLGTPPQFSPDAIFGACEKIVLTQWPHPAREQYDAILAEAVLKTLRVGFVAATAGQTDPTLADFLAAIPEHLYLRFPRDLCLRAILHSPVAALGRPLTEQMAHPLLRLARLNYGATPIEGAAMEVFLTESLAALGVTEDECPTAEADLAGWITRALTYGRHLQAERPERVAAILAETGEVQVQHVRELVAEVVGIAGGTLDLQRLVPAILDTAFVGTKVDWYGQNLARVLYVADFAVWVPWV